MEIGFYGGSFTGISEEEQEWYLKIGYSYIEEGRVNSMRVSTRPDYISEEILSVLGKYRVGTIELGAQSLDEEVLRTSNRGHDIKTVEKAAAMIREYGFKLGIQTMVGLPGDSYEKAILTAGKVVGMKPDMVRIYPTLVIKNTYLQKMYQEGRYRPLSIEEAVDICAGLLEIYEKNDINVIRIGLQPTDTINENGEVEAGPFHPAFRQLVQSRLIRNKMVKYIEQNNLSEAPDIVIEANPKQMSGIVGQKRQNIIKIKEMFNFRNIKVEANSNIDLFSIKIFN